jgi:hypothetical protein
VLSPDSKRVIRTALQIVVGLAAALPLLIHTANLPDTLPGLGVALTVAAAVTKAMAAGNEWLPAWLRLDAVAVPPSGPRHAAGTPAETQPAPVVAFDTLPGPPSATTYTPVSPDRAAKWAPPATQDQSPGERPDPAPAP